MNISEIDRVARYLIDQIGRKATQHAKENIDWSDAIDDVVGAKDWTEVVRRIECLQNE